MILIPAVDIRDGRAVRLERGSFAHETVYAADPLDAARSWVEAGARALHVVDLDGARSGEPAGLEHLRRIARAVDVPVQYGGGLRTLAAVDDALAAGAARAVVGTAALRDDAFLHGAVQRFGDRAWVALDARAGEATVAGWTEATGSPVGDALERVLDAGVAGIVYTEVERDGMLTGPDLDAVRGVADAVGDRAAILYSGGVGAVGDLRSLAAVGAPALRGVISGKALYERRFTVAEGQAALDEGVATRPEASRCS